MPKEKSYFIKNCFTELIFPDQGFAELTSSARRIRKIIFAVSLLLSVLFLAGLSFCIINSYLNNKGLIAKLNKDTKSVAEIKWDNKENFQENLLQLHELRQDIVELSGYEVDGVPWALGFGLYKGDELISTLEKFYLFKLNEILILPLKEEIELELVSYSRINQKKMFYKLYNTLKVYLMLSTPGKADIGFLKNENIYDYWKNYIARTYKGQMNEKVYKTLHSEFVYYLSKISKSDRKYIIKADADSIKQARTVLSQVEAAELVYEKVISKIKQYPLRFESILPAKSQNIVLSSYELPGAFTIDGYKHFKRVSIQESKVSKSIGWVLGDEKQRGISERKEIINCLKKIYVDEYLKEWNKFIGGLSIAPFSDVNDLLEKLDVLSDNISSPFVLLFNAMSKNIQLNICEEAKSRKKLEKVGENVIYRFGRRIFGSAASSLSPKDVVSKKEGRCGRCKDNALKLKKEAETLSVFLKKGLVDYLEILKGVRVKLSEPGISSDQENDIKVFTQSVFSVDSNKLNNGLRGAKKIADDLRLQSKDDIKRLFSQVLFRIGDICAKTTLKKLNELWKTKVYREYEDKFQNKYPFSKNSSDEVSINEFAGFFKPDDGTVWEFYDKELKFFLDESSSEPKGWRNIKLPFSDKFLRFYEKAGIIKKSLFKGGKQKSPSIDFSISAARLEGDSVGKIQFYLNAQKLNYIGGPEFWKNFSWPENKYKENYPNAKLIITYRTSRFDEEENSRKESTKGKGFDGEWAFLKLLDDAKIMTKNKKFFNMKWSFHLEERIEPVEVGINFKTKEEQSFFIPGIFSSIDCPQQIQ